MTASELDDFGMDLPLIAIVEDNPLLRRAIVRSISRLDCMISEDDRGEDAFASGNLERADVAIVDIGLPGMSGIDVVRQIKAERGDSLPVIVTSGSAAPADRIAAFEAGADDFVPKPIHLPELERRVLAFLRLRDALVETRQERDRAEQINLYASEAAGLLAHDLANGLGISLCNLEFLAETAKWADEEEQDACESTLRALRKMIALVNNFVEIRQLEDAAVVAEPADHGIHEVLTDVASLHRHEAEVKRARVEVVCAPDLRADVDPVLFERMIHNIMGNAIRYVNEHGVVYAQAEIDGDGQLVVSVANSGAEIPESVRATMFDKYVTSGERGKRRGMGLYFCRLASEAHGGSIGIESRPGFPATFVIRLPARCASSQQPSHYQGELSCAS